MGHWPDMRSFAFGTCLAATALWAMAPNIGMATPLEPAACGDLEKEKATLESAGISDDLRLKPTEAKALPGDRLKRIQRYVEVSGQVLFRCSQATLAAGPASDTPPAKDAGAKSPKTASPVVPASAKKHLVRTKRRKR
jgi:hypothetical protein